MKTNYSTTISMSIEEGEDFIKAGGTRSVYSTYNKYLGVIPSSYFNQHKKVRYTKAGKPVYVCAFLKS